MRSFFRFLGKLIGGAVVFGIPALLAYLHFVGFSPEWRAKVAEAIGGRLFSVQIERLTFNPFRGIVANQVTVSQKSGQMRRLAELDRLIVSLSIADLLNGRVNIALLDLRHAMVSIPFAEDGGVPDTIQLSDLNASILNDGGRLTVSEASFEVEGIRFSMTGEFLNPEAIESAPAPPEDPTKRVAMIRSILEAIHEVRFAGADVEVDLNGDLSKPETISAPVIRFEARGLDYRGFQLGQLEVRAAYADRRLSVRELRMSGQGTDLLASGSWNLEPGGGEATLTGRFDANGILRLLNKPEIAEQLKFQGAPQVNMQLTANAGASGVDMFATGDIMTGAFAFKGVEIEAAGASFAWKDSRLFVQDAMLKSRTGTVKASVMSAPGDFRVKLESNANPTEFAPLFGPNERKILDLMEFGDEPEVRLSLTGTAPKTDAIRGTGTLKLGRTAMRGAWIDSGTSEVEFQDRAVLYRDFTVQRGSGRATGSFTYDFGRREVRLEDVKSDLDPVKVLMWVDPRISATVAVYRFHEPPAVTVDGMVHMKDPSKNDLRITVDAESGLDYDLLNRTLSFGATDAKVHLKGRHVLADVSQAALMGGDVTVDADVSTDPDNPKFGATVTVSKVDFPSLTKLYFGYSKSEGRMSGRYEFEAKLREPGSMHGQGSIKVEEGHVLAIPLFGPLSAVISAIIPGAGHESARLATADFQIADGKVTTSNLDIAGEGFEMFGEGSIGFPSGDLDLTMRINAKGIPGIVLFPVSKLLEYVSTGTMSDPQWRPKIVPREFFDILGLGGNARAKPRPPARTR